MSSRLEKSNHPSFILAFIDKKSEGQQSGKRANEETIEARGLSTEKMEMDNTASQTDIQPHQHDIIQPKTEKDQAENDQLLPMDVVTNANNNNNHHDNLSCEDSPDLLKTLKTVKAIKKTLMKSPKILTKKEANSKKKSNTTVIGIPEPPSQVTITQQEFPSIPDTTKEATTNNCQTNVVNSSAKEDGDPQQLPASSVATAPPVTTKTALTVAEDDGKADKEEHSFSENMSVCSDTPSKREKEGGEVTQPVGERADVATSESGLRQHVSTCQETNNYSLSYLDAAVVAAAITVAKVTSNSSTSLQLQPTSRNASDSKEKLLDSTQNDLECKEEKKEKKQQQQQQQDNHVNDPTNNRQHTDIIATTPQQQEIATPQNSPSINADTNDSFQKKEDISNLTKESRSEMKTSNKDKVEEAMTKIEDVAEELKNIKPIPYSKKTHKKTLNLNDQVKDENEEKKTIDLAPAVKKTPKKPLNLKRQAKKTVTEEQKNVDSASDLQKNSDSHLELKHQVEVVAEELKNIDSVPDIKKNPDKPLNLKLEELKHESSKSRSESPLQKERQRKKSESLEKAEQWLRDRMDQRAKSSTSSRKTSESSSSLPPPATGNDYEQKKQANCQDTHSSTNKSVEDEKVIPESIPLVTQVTQTISQQQPMPSPPVEPVVADNRTHWLNADLENEKPTVTVDKRTHWLAADLENEKPTPINVMRSFSPPTEVPTRSYSPPPMTNGSSKAMSPPPSSATNTTIPSRFRNMWQNSKTERIPAPTSSKETSVSRRSSVSKESSIPRRGSVFDHSANESKRSSGADQLSRRGSIMEPGSRFNTPFQSRQPSPSASKSRATSPDSNGKPYYSSSKMATVVTSTDVLSRAKSINQLNEQANASSRRPTISNGTDSNRSKSLSKDYSNSSSSAFTKRGSTEDSKPKNESKPVREFSPVILVRPSTFIQAMNPPPSPQAKPKDYVNAPSTRDRSNQDRIPSRFRKAMHHTSSSSSNSTMTRARSIHDLHQDTALENHAMGLQDQIRQARAEHRKFFDDAQSHTTYNSNSRSARDRMSAEWNRTSSMRNLRASPARDYRRL